MEWQQIIGFHQLVRHGSFTRAASASFRTQSALSQQVRKLEEELGCRLVDRTGRRRFRLTPEGERLYVFTSAVMAGYEGLLDNISAMRGLPRGRLAIAAPFTTLYHLFPEQLSFFLKRYPHVELTILDRPRDEAVGMVKTGEIELAIVPGSHLPGGLEARRWKQVETVLMVPDRHPLVKARGIRLSDITGHPLILPPRGTENRRFIEGLFDGEGLRYRVIMESGNVELSSRYVEAGIGISFATIVKGIDPLKGRKIRFLSVEGLSGTDYLAVVSRKGRLLPPYVLDFISQVLSS